MTDSVTHKDTVDHHEVTKKNRPIDHLSDNVIQAHPKTNSYPITAKKEHVTMHEINHHSDKEENSYIELQNIINIHGVPYKRLEGVKDGEECIHLCLEKTQCQYAAYSAVDWNTDIGVNYDKGSCYLFYGTDAWKNGHIEGVNTYVITKLPQKKVDYFYYL